ncbi:MAG TPA: FAD-dependent oxidoreductase, partial [Phenylobacterium sp.]|nr:FAD-dependent oxidoreductase [Phenylobacterium sp.]
MSRGGEVRVAGAGALGLSCALALADAGCAVTVYDPAPEGQNASGVAAGMLAPVFETVLDAGSAGNFDLLSAARDLWPALAQRAGIGIDRAGAVAVGSPTWLAAVADGIEALGLPATELSGAPLRALTPAVAARFSRGIGTPEDWWLDPRS